MSWRLNGTSDRFDAALGLAGMPLTMACWFWSPADLAAIGTLMHWGVAGDTSGYIVRVRDDLGGKTLEASTRDVALNGRADFSAGAVPRGRWCHAAGVFASTTDVFVFLDAVAGVGPVSAAGAPTAPTALNLGYNGRGGGALHYFAGRIAHAAIWAAALTAAEIAALAGGRRPDTVRPAALVEYWPMTRRRPQRGARRSARLASTGAPVLADGPSFLEERRAEVLRSGWLAAAAYTPPVDPPYAGGLAPFGLDPFRQGSLGVGPGLGPRALG